jgi:hypothetical protein
MFKLTPGAVSHHGGRPDALTRDKETTMRVDRKEDGDWTAGAAPEEAGTGFWRRTFSRRWVLTRPPAVLLAGTLLAEAVQRESASAALVDSWQRASSSGAEDPVGIAFVQWGDSGNASMTSGESFDLPADVTAGNSVVLHIWEGSGIVTTRVSGGGFTTWIKACSRTGDGAGEIWYAIGSNGGSKAITITNSGGIWSAQAIEYSGVGSFVASSTITSPPSTNNLSLSTTGPGQVVDIMLWNSGGTAKGPASPWVDYAGSGAYWKLDGPNGTQDVAYSLPSSSGQQTATWTLGTSGFLVGIVLSPSVTGATLSQPYGFPTSHVSDSITTIAVTPVRVGDLMLFGAWLRGDSADSISSVSGGGCTGWTKIDGWQAKTFANRMELWYGIVTTTGSQTITVTYTPANFTSYSEFIAEEISSPYGASAIWTVVASGSTDSASTTSVTLPSLRSGPSGLQGYVGYWSQGNYTIPGWSQGFSYFATAAEDGVCYDLNLAASTAYAPTAAAAGFNWQAVGVIVSASEYASPPPASAPPLRAVVVRQVVNRSAAR